jgi:hypothetical protein
VDLSFCSSEVVTPHVAWAKPYSGGKAAVAFFLGGPEACREVVELAERFDFTPFASLGGFTNAGDDSGTYYRLLDPSLVSAKYNALLAPERAYDAVVLSGDTWDHLTEFSKSRLRDMIEKGAGLVWIGPATKDPDALDMLPAAGRGKTSSGVWTLDDDHFITRAIPFAALPPTQRWYYREIRGKVIASSGGAPLVVLGEYGKGRVALLNYVASERVGNESATDGLLPHERVYPHIELPYWEYQYGLIGRAILWTTRKEPAEEIVDIRLPADLSAESSAGKEIALRVSAPARMQAGLEFRFLDSHGDTLDAGTQPLALREGMNTVFLPLPALPAGMNLVHLILKTPQGASDWRAVALPTEGEASITAVKLSSDSYDRSQSVRAEVTVETPRRAPAPRSAPGRRPRPNPGAAPDVRRTRRHALR